MPRKPKVSSVDVWPQVIETFSRPYVGMIYKLDEPSSFNGIVQVETYRITVEKIPESNEVYAARVRKLWRKCDNHHHRDPLRQAAKKYGVELDDAENGVDAPPRRY